MNDFFDITKTTWLSPGTGDNSAAMTLHILARIRPQSQRVGSFLYDHMLRHLFGVIGPLAVPGNLYAQSV